MTTEEKLDATIKELNQVKHALATLIAWLDHDIGRHNVDKLLGMLSGTCNP